jgi:hypothetical protein
VIGGVVDAHLLDIPHQEDKTERVGQFVDRSLKQPSDLRPRSCALRIRDDHTWKHDHASVSAENRLVDFVDLVGGTAAPEACERLVEDDPREPGAQARVAPELAERRISPDIGFL